MAAWNVTRRWNQRWIDRYRRFVPRQVRSFRANGDRFTCEDLALRLIIDFAAASELPVALASGVSPNGLQPHQRPSLEAFRNDVLRTTAASDLLRDHNTVGVGNAKPGGVMNLHAARPGDIVFLEYDERFNHTQVVMDNSGGGVRIAQGNLTATCNAFELLIGNRNDPSDECYDGVAIALHGYDRDGVYSRTGERVFADKKGRIRRWNFEKWNRLASFSNLSHHGHMAPSLGRSR